MVEYIPMTLQSRVCMCNPPGPYLSASRKREMLMNHCATCGNPYRWYVRICVACKEPFIKDFRKKSVDCVRHTKCWGCINKINEWHDALMILVCDCEKEQTNREDFTPLGLNPRKVSKEERSNAFTFKGPFQGDK